MKTLVTISRLRMTFLAAILTLGGSAQAVTTTLTRSVETDTTNRPFFSQAAFPTFANERGYVGTATPGASNASAVTNADAGLGGNDTIAIPMDNGLPLGVGLSFGVSFMVDAVDPSHLLTDAGNPGLAIDSTASGTESNTTRLTAGEKLHFSDIQLTAPTVYDPLELLVPGSLAIGNPLWRSLRQNGNNVANSPTVTVSSDAAGTQNVFQFAPSGGQGIILNDPAGVFPAISPLYVNTTAGAWPLKAIGYQLDLTYELAPPPASRRTFQFGDPGVTYDGVLTHQLTSNDTTVTIAAIGDASALLDTNNLGVGVNSAEDDVTLGVPTGNANQRFIDGTLTTPEAIHFSFDRDVSLESLTLGNIDLNGSESVVLKFVSGTNPFAGLSGYTGNYTLGADSLTFSSAGGGQTPYAITYGKNGQDEILVEAGTILALTANPAVGNGFILDMLTVNRPGAVAPDADFDNDGQVDADDLATWQTGFGSTTATDMTGDAEGDADVDGADFLQWQQQYTGPGGIASVPEPSSVGLLAFAVALRIVTRRRK